ncbi:MAG: hypothetical protein GQF41_3205 [Candidatus Rifleibacterium amylolyticum]|nr:MAG: hypothetical protein GQF41_3205 [Candidatus Rifleibacterium amylolyticum]
MALIAKQAAEEPQAEAQAREKTEEPRTKTQRHEENLRGSLTQRRRCAESRNEVQIYQQLNEGLDLCAPAAE